MNTPITDAMEASIEAAGKRDVPVRLYQRMRALEASNAELLEACKEFVRKVECGEAKSIRSYAQMKAAIKKATE